MTRCVTNKTGLHLYILSSHIFQAVRCMYLHKPLKINEQGTHSAPCGELQNRKLDRSKYKTGLSK